MTMIILKGISIFFKPSEFIINKRHWTIELYKHLCIRGLAPSKLSIFTYFYDAASLWVLFVGNFQVYSITRKLLKQFTFLSLNIRWSTYNTFILKSVVTNFYLSVCDYYIYTVSVIKIPIWNLIQTDVMPIYLIFTYRAKYTK